MPSSQKPSPAEIAAEEAQQQVLECLKGGKSFTLEAGAGAGKTYTLIKALQWLISDRGDSFERRNQKIACITYTNVARDEIDSRTDGHPMIFSGTVHAFCWSVISKFQTQLAKALPSIPAWEKRLDDVGGIGSRAVTYELGYPKVYDNHVTLHHNDVITLTSSLFNFDKFRKLLSDRYPILLIDEYQDTDKLFVQSLQEHYLNTNNGPLIGFFGDPWQTIYATSGCGNIEHENLVRIGKKANFRSVNTIIESLNRIRPDLPQHAKEPDSVGSIAIFHTNNWQGERLKGAHWAEDLPAEDAHNYLKNSQRILEAQGWDFSPDQTKVLMLTHRVLAKEMGYENLLGVFRSNDDLVKKENPYIAFFVDIIEPASRAYKDKRYGEMFAALGQKAPKISSLTEKRDWASFMDSILELRSSGAVHEVLSLIKKSKKIYIPSAIRTIEKELRKFSKDSEFELSTSAKIAQKLKSIDYAEIVSVFDFINDHTPFSTKHGVKGAEFENVLVAFGRGWNQYNFNEYLEWASNPHSIPQDKQQKYERNRNLFYVVCSRPKTRLSLLFTQELSAMAMGTLESWFGRDSIQGL